MNIITDTSAVRIGETDRHHRLSVPALTERLQELAWAHSVAREVDVPRLLAQGVSWVLSRLHVAVTELPTYQQRVTLTTWVSAIDRYFYYRQFRLTDATAGGLLVRATSIWAVLDVATRRLTTVPDFIRDKTPTYADGQPLPDLPPKPTWPTTFVPTAASNVVAPTGNVVTVRWFDIDANAHVNNTRYVQWLLEALPAEHLATHALRSLDVLFRAEATLGETLTADAAPANAAATLFRHRIGPADGSRELVVAETRWQ